MQRVSTGVNWRKNVKREPKWTRIITVHFKLLVHSAIVKWGLLNSTKDHCLHVMSYQHDQDEGLMSEIPIEECVVLHDVKSEIPA